MVFSTDKFWDSAVGLGEVWADPDWQAMVIEIKRILGKRKVVFMLFPFGVTSISRSTKLTTGDANEIQVLPREKTFAATRSPYALSYIPFATNRCRFELFFSRVFGAGFSSAVLPHDLSLLRERRLRRGPSEYSCLALPKKTWPGSRPGHVERQILASASEAILGVDVPHAADRAVVGSDVCVGVRERVGRQRRQPVGHVVHAYGHLEAIKPLTHVQLREVAR
jgi:hypothetical protein